MSGSQFDEIAREYDATLPAHVVEHYLEKRADFIVDRCAPARALDVGCGTGALAGRLAQRGVEVTGIDPSAEMLSVLRERAPSIRAVTGSATQLPFADREFDLSYCVAVMHHIADPSSVRASLGEMVRVVRPGGRVLVWDHNPANPYWPFLMRRVPQDTGDERLIPVRELTGGLEAGGARILSVERTGFVPDFAPGWLLGVFRLLERVVERVPGLRRLCAHNVIVAEKPA